MALPPLGAPLIIHLVRDNRRKLYGILPNREEGKMQEFLNVWSKRYLIGHPASGRVDIFPLDEPVNSLIESPE